MAIITISRELAALGDETAQELANLLDYRLVDKPALEERIKSYGIAGHKLEKYDERKPTFLASLSQDRDEYLHYLKTAMFATAAEGNCVFIGRGANAVFSDIPGRISISLVAPYGIRVERVKSYFHCDERRARQILDQSDRDRSGFHRYFFDTEWKEPANYHLVLNSGHMAPPACARIIKQLSGQIFSPDLEAKAALRLQELILAQRVIHHIIYERGIGIHFLEAEVSGTAVELFGVANSQALIEAALTAAQEVQPVSSVNSTIQMVRDYNILP